jgi:hypothetical protein
MHSSDEFNAEVDEAEGVWKPTFATTVPLNNLEFGTVTKIVEKRDCVTPDPFRAVDDLTIEYVDSAAGSRKTSTAIKVSLVRAQQGVKTIFAMPTLELINEIGRLCSQLRR